jgi:hypothetical protein
MARLAGGRPPKAAAGGAAEGGGGSGGGGPATAPLRQPATAARSLTRRDQAARECSFDRKLALFGLLMHGATQVVSLLAWSSLPFSERFQRLLSPPGCYPPLPPCST